MADVLYKIMMTCYQMICTFCVTRYIDIFVFHRQRKFPSQLLAQYQENLLLMIVSCYVLFGKLQQKYEILYSIATKNDSHHQKANKKLRERLSKCCYSTDCGAKSDVKVGAKPKVYIRPHSVMCQSSNLICFNTSL